MPSRSTNNPRFGLRGQSVVVAALFSLCLASVLVFYSLPRETEWINQSFTEAAERSLSQLGASITSNMLTAQYAELYESIDAQLRQRPDWLAIRVVDAQGMQIYPLEDWDPALAGNGVLIEVPIAFMAERMGSISLIANFDAQVGQGRELLYRQAALQLVLLALLLLMLFVLLERAAVQPLRGLMQAFREMAAGNFKAGLPDAPPNEVGKLISEFAVTRKEVQRDRARLEQLRHEAEAANLAKTDFLASMSHELRTPLNAILGLAELSAADNSISPQHRAHAEHIHEAGEHLLALINNLLDLSAIESGKIKLSVESLRLPDLARECMNLVEVLAVERGIRCVTELDAIDGVLVSGDYTRLKQVVFNLLSNAVKYNRAKGQVRLIGEVRPGQKVRISVQDTGEGLSQKQLEKLFTPFERLGAEMGAVQGSGIGLVITRELVQQMGGEIGVESVLGKGSTFWIELPRVDAQDVPGRVASEPLIDAGRKKNPQLRPLRILVAEDNPLNREVIAHQIRVLGHDAEFAHDGEEAWHKLQQSRFDLLLTDIQMPRLDGTALVRRIREREDPDVRMPVFAMTANVMHDDVKHYLACGVDQCLGKPTSLKTLRELLDDPERWGASRAPALAAGSAEAIGSGAVPAAGVSSGQFNELGEGLNLEFLVDNFGDDPALFCTFFKSFLNDAPDHVERITRAVQHREAEAAAREAHALKSTSATLGADALSSSCAAVESEARAGRWEQLDGLAATLARQCDAACVQMRVYCEAHTG